MPSTDDNVTFIENGCLSGGDAEGRLIEPKTEAVTGRLDVRSDGRGSVAELRVTSRDRGEQASGSGHVTSRERGSRTDDDGVRRRIAPERERRPAGRDAEPSPLARGEAPESRMRPDGLAALVDDEALTPGDAVPLDEVAVVATAEKARLLALGAACDGQARPLGLRARLLFRLLAQWEPDPLEMARVEPSEHVRLILPRIDGPGEKRPAAMLDDPRVVTGRQPR